MPGEVSRSADRRSRILLLCATPLHAPPHPRPLPRSTEGEGDGCSTLGAVVGIWRRTGTAIAILYLPSVFDLYSRETYGCAVRQPHGRRGNSRGRKSLRRLRGPSARGRA